MSTIPNNSLQQRLQQITKQQQKPSYGVKKTLAGKIVKVLDPNEPIPASLQLTLQMNPGKLYALVELKNKKQYFLAFKENVEMVYAIYGDSNQLINREINVEYYDQNIENGSISIASRLHLPITDIESSIFVVDIGGIL